MKKWLFVIVAALIIGLGAALYISFKENQKLSEQWKTASANIKAYDLELSDAKKKNVAYQFTVDQLEYFQDSILKELNTTREELGIKDSKIKSLQYVASQFSKKDTIVLNDTIFKDPKINVDTLIGDAWYHVRVGLKYPSTIAVEPQFKSEKHVVISTKRETVNPPKKFFLFRWFQKKHTVIQVDVVEKNPYVENESSKYIEIIK